MQSVREILPGTWHIALKRFDDLRGSFVKTHARSALETQGLQFDAREEFYSFSHKGVVRGMHFQLPPHDHAKLVYCPIGAVLDVLVDLRSGAGQGCVASVQLSGDEPAILLIPKGIAHGFRSLSDNSLMIYKTSTEHVPTHDAGIHWKSIGFDWGIDDAVVSARDSAHPALANFVNPF